MEVMYAKNIDNSFFSDKNFLGFIGEYEDLTNLISNLTSIRINLNHKVKKEISNNTELLNLLGLPNDLLKTKIKDLSSGEIKLIKLIKIANLHPELIVLNNFDLGFNYKEKSKISRFIKTINATYHTNFIIITNDLLFINKNTKNIIVSKNKIIKYQGDLITAIKQNLIPKPVIIEFIDKANLKDVNLDYTLDHKELLKAIYRSVF